MKPDTACQKMINYFQEELRISKVHHAQRVQRYRDDEQNDQQNDQQGQEVFAGQYQEDMHGNLHLVGQLKDPSTHPSKPQELKNPATKVAPVSAQSVKNDGVISRRLPKNVSLPKFDI
jgi:predicted Ser/Thr protein kinase